MSAGCLEPNQEVDAKVQVRGGASLDKGGGGEDGGTTVGDTERDTITSVFCLCPPLLAQRPNSSWECFAMHKNPLLSAPDFMLMR